MEDEASELIALEQLFMTVLNPHEVSEASAEISRLTSNPDFIIKILALTEFTKNEHVRLLCSIQCFHMLGKHSELYPLDFQQGLLTKFFLYIEQPNPTDYYVLCIEKLAENSPDLQQCVIEYIENRKNMPELFQWIQTNPNSFVHFMNFLLFLYPMCKYLHSLDFSHIILFCFQNNALLPNNVIVYCLKFMQCLCYIHNDSNENEESQELNQNYALAFQLFGQIPFLNYFGPFWRSAIEFVCGGMLSDEQSQYLHKVAIDLLTSEQSGINSTHKILLSLLFSSHIDDFESDFVVQFFEICFQLFSQLFNENSYLPIEYLNMFDEIFHYKEESSLNIEMHEKIYLDLKTQLLSSESNVIVKSTAIALLTKIDEKIIMKDFDVYMEIIGQSLDSKIAFIQEAACLNIVKIYEKESIAVWYKFFDFIPLFIQKIVELFGMEELTAELLMQFIDVFIDLSEIEHSFGDWGKNSEKYKGLFDVIFGLAPLFSQSNFSTFVQMLFLAFRLDPTVENDRMEELYKIIIAAFESKDDEKLMETCFSLLSSMIKRNNEIDFAFTFPLIQYIVSESNINSLIHSALQFVCDILTILHEAAGEFGSACMEFLIPKFDEIESTRIKLDCIKIFSLTSKYTTNVEAAGFVFNYVFAQMEKDRDSFKHKLLEYCQKVIRLLSMEQITQLLTLSISIFADNSSSILIQESISIIYKILKHFTVNEPQLIEVRKIINDYISHFNPDENGLEVYSDTIMQFSKLIAEIWKYENPENLLYFDFLLSYTQVYISKFNEKDGNEEFFDYGQQEISEIFSTFSDAFEHNIFDASSQDRIQRLIQFVPDIARISSSECLKMNICFLIGKLIDIDITIVIPFVDQFLLQWFQQEIEDDQDSELIPNLSFLFFKIFSITKPLFPSSNGLECIKLSIQFFPSSDLSSNTKLLFDQIMLCFFNEVDISSLLETDQSFVECYSLLIVSFSKLLQMNENDIAQCNLDQNDILNIKKAISTILTSFPVIHEHVLTLMSNEDVSQLLSLCQ